MHTPLCDLLGIDAPIIQAGMGPFTDATLVAAVATAGGLGSLGSSQRSPDQLRDEIARIRDRTDRPYAVNFLVSDFNEESFQVALAARAPIVSFALGDPGAWVQRAHDAGAKVLHQVHTVVQAEQAAAGGVDVLIAQGGEAGGFGQYVATLPLLPQVVDAVRPLPVVAAGGIADGRGLAAALVLGAVGVNLGTRFLASVEAPIAPEWKQAIVAGRSEETVKVEFWNDIMPRPGLPGYGTVPRALRTPFHEQWAGRRQDARAQAEAIRAEMLPALMAGRFHEYVPFAGETVGLIRDILPVADIIRRLVDEATAALQQATALGAQQTHRR
jgi:enoyl-[acyl-carrier protein] reductase II